MHPRTPRKIDDHVPSDMEHRCERSKDGEKIRTIVELMYVAFQPIPADAAVGLLGDVWVSPQNIQVRQESGWMDWVRAPTPSKSRPHELVQHPFIQEYYLNWRVKSNTLEYSTIESGYNWRQNWHDVVEKDKEVIFSCWERSSGTKFDQTTRSWLEAIFDGNPSYNNLLPSFIGSLVFATFVEGSVSISLSRIPSDHGILSNAASRSVVLAGLRPVDMETANDPTIGDAGHGALLPDALTCTESEPCRSIHAGDTSAGTEVLCSEHLNGAVSSSLEAQSSIVVGGQAEELEITEQPPVENDMVSFCYLR